MVDVDVGTEVDVLGVDVLGLVVVGAGGRVVVVFGIGGSLFSFTEVLVAMPSPMAKPAASMPVPIRRGAFLNFSSYASIASFITSSWLLPVTARAVIPSKIVLLICISFTASPAIPGLRCGGLWYNLDTNLDSTFL